MSVKGSKVIQHGFAGTKIYAVWQHIKARCYNPNIKHYERYGGRGICMQENWKNYFKEFYDYVSSLP